MDEDVVAVVTLRMALYVHNTLPRPSDQEQAAVFEDLLLKCFGVITGAESEASLRLSKPDLWLIQGIAKSHATVGNEEVGKAWLAIVSHGLLHLSAQTDVHQAVMRQGDGVEEEPASRQEALDKLRKWPNG